MEKFSENTEMQATDCSYNVLPHRSKLITSSLLNSEEGIVWMVDSGYVGIKIH